MAWVAVTKQGREFISMCNPTRVTDEDNYYGWKVHLQRFLFLKEASRGSSEENLLGMMNP